MKLSSRPDALLELEDAIFYYEDCQKILGKQLNQEIKSAVKLITMHPEAWAAMEMGSRPKNKGKLIVVIIPSCGECYLSTPLFSHLEVE